MSSRRAIVLASGLLLCQLAMGQRQLPITRISLYAIKVDHAAYPQGEIPFRPGSELLITITSNQDPKVRTAHDLHLLAFRGPKSVIVQMGHRLPKDLGAQCLNFQYSYYLPAVIDGTTLRTYKKINKAWLADGTSRPLDERWTLVPVDTTFEDNEGKDLVIDGSSVDEFFRSGIEITIKSDGLAYSDKLLSNIKFFRAPEKPQYEPASLPLNPSTCYALKAQTEGDGLPIFLARAGQCSHLAQEP